MVDQSKTNPTNTKPENGDKLPTAGGDKAPKPDENNANAQGTNPNASPDNKSDDTKPAVEADAKETRTEVIARERVYLENNQLREKGERFIYIHKEGEELPAALEAVESRKASGE